MAATPPVDGSITSYVVGEDTGKPLIVLVKVTEWYDGAGIIGVRRMCWNYENDKTNRVWKYTAYSEDGSLSEIEGNRFST